MTSCGFANWELRSFFSGVQGEDYLEYFAQVKEEIVTLEKRATGFVGTDNQKADVSSGEAAQFCSDLENLEAKVSHLRCYIECVRSEDIANTEAQEAQSRLEGLEAQFRKLEVGWIAYLRLLSETEFNELMEEPVLEGACYQLERARYEAQHSMDPAQEKLAADLEISGFKAWENLYENIAGSLNFTIEDSQGQSRQVPMSLKVSLLEDPDDAVRRSALVNSNKAWEGAAEAVGAALNNIAGYRLKLQEWRNSGHFLQEAAFESGLKRTTLENMMDTVAREWELPRRYLRLKAKLLNKERLGFQDLVAPINFAEVVGADKAVAQSTHIYTWSEAVTIIEKAFTDFDPDFGQFARQALEKHWVESEVRPGKRPGGFCTSSLVLGESRIFITYQGSLGDVFTLAHELGHAYHEYLMKGLRPCAHAYPMTLAETASTFAENLLSDYLLAHPELGGSEGPEVSEQEELNRELPEQGSANQGQLDQIMQSQRLERLKMYQRRLDDAASYLLNIPMRYFFEKAFYEQRPHKNFTAQDFCNLMLETQKKVYGDTLDSNELDPWFWASKGHFYITEVSFYNFPYTFGYLFSSGVYARAVKEGKAFLPTFRKLLRLTGSASCEDTAREALGVDLQGSQFWQDSLTLVKRDLDAFEALLK